MVTIKTYSMGDAAAHLTRCSGEYFATHRVAKAVKRLIARGTIPERKAGRARILLEDDLRVVEAEFGMTPAMITGTCSG